MTQYTLLQIVKHALQYYITRPDASEKDIQKEKKALDIVTNEVNHLKEVYGIEDKKEGE